MKRSKFTSVYTSFLLLLFAVLFLGFFSNPPNGNTGAPGDGLCTSCHSPGNPNGYDGEIIIENFPATPVAGTEYSLTARVTNPNGLAVRAGFQAVVLDGSNNNAGDLMVSGSNPTTTTSGGREYVEHNPGLNFPGSNEVIWDFTWTAPNGPNGEVITIWAAGNIASGSGSNNDLIVTTSVSGTLDATSMPLEVEIVSSSNVSCNGGNNGSASAAASGGTGPYTYNWSNGASGATVTNLTAGVHTVTATDNLGATATANVTITEPSLLEASITNQTNVTCTNATGSATAAGSGGTPPYSYNWPSGNMNATETGLPPGLFTVTVTDNNQCMASATVTITEDTTPPVVDAGPDQELNCNVSVVILDGSNSTSGPTYIYNWTTFDGLLCGGENTATASACAPGTYTLMVTCLENGCTASDQAVVTEIPDLSLMISDIDVFCFGESTGSIDLTVTGGQGPFAYDWNDDTLDGIEDPVGLGAGTYCVTVTDNVGCSDFICTEITEPSEIVIAFNPMDALCNGECTGAIDLNVIGGTPSYTYDWSNGDTAEDPTGLCADNYTVTVTDANGCTATQSITINEPAEITISGTVTDVSCNGSCDGSISATASGGAGSYTFEWSDSNGNVLATTPDIDGLCAGDYTLIVTDGNGCTAQMIFSVSEPTAISISGTVNDASCNGECTGSIDITVTGGTAPYTFLWGTNPQQDTEDVTNLCAGDYTVTVTDANGCTETATFTVGEPTPASITASVTDVTCNNTCDGAIDITVTGGTSPYSFNWDNNLPAVEDQDNLCAGVYSVTVTDANNCSSVLTASVGEPSAISITSTVSNISCNGDCDGAIDITVEGGTPGYTYIWDNGTSEEDLSGLCSPGDYSVTVTDNNGCTAEHTATITEPDALSIELSIQNTSCNGSCDGSIMATPSGGTGSYSYLWNTTPEQNAQTATGLCAGDYEVTVTDDNGCTATATGTVSEPAAFEISANVTNASCNGVCDGAIDLSVTGGTSPYSYDWDNGATTEDQMDLCAGLYTVVITDDNGCTAISSVTVSEPSSLEATAVTTDATCNGLCDGTVNVTVAGGTAPYTYNWSGPYEGPDPVNVCAGDHTVTITDANGCFITLDVTINEPAALTLEASIEHILCNGDCNGAIDLTASGGVLPYSYQWSTGSGEEDVLGLCAGDYSVTVTDANGCTAVAAYTIEEPPAIALSLSSTNETSNGANDGTATATPSGGNGGFSFQWDDPASQTTQTATGLEPGTYCVTVTDANGCTQEGCVTVNPFDCTLEVSIVTQDALCNGEASGSATANASGGTEPYTYAWSTGGDGSTESNIPAGSHSLTITDANGCILTETFDIGEPTGIVISGVVTATTCGACNGAIEVVASGGTGPFSYAWSDGLGTSENVSDLCAGEYTVTATDSNGCEGSLSFSVPGSSNLIVSVSSTNETTPGANDGTATASPSSENPPYTYLWDNGATTATITGLAPGDYCVTVTDDIGCTATACTTVSAGNCNLEGLVMVQNPTCAGGEDGEALASVTGGMSPYTYNWSTGGTGNPETGLSAGTYMLTITDAEGCTFTSTFVVGEPDPIVISAAVTNVTCNGLCDGIVDLEVTGGTAPYSYEWSGPCEGPNPMDVCAGTFTVTVTDANGCTGSLDVTITEPEALSLEAEIIHELCEGDCNGAIDLSILGGTAPYFIEWSTGSGEEDLSGLCPGTYMVFVTDTNGCTAEGTYVVNEAPLFNVSIESTNETAEGADDGTATATPDGGTPGFIYLWSNGATTQTITGLPPGDYCVTVTDSNNCTTEACTTILPFGCNITLEVSGDNFTCPEFCNGTIDLTVTGGEAPYTYSWSNGSTDEDPTELCEGVYTVVVTDANGCTAITSGTVNTSPTMVLEFEYSGSNCITPCNGVIDLTVMNGTSPYTYQWFDSSGTLISNEEDLTDICPGTYSVIVTDANGCTVQQSFTTPVPEPIEATVSVTDASCFGLCDGAIDLEVTGGVPPYTYEWSGGLPPTEDQTGLCADTYTVTITGDDDCSVEVAAVVNEPAELVIDVVTTNPTCFGLCDGAATINATGGTPPYTFTGPIVDLCPGDYTTTVTDANGCVATTNFVIEEPPELTVSIDSIGDEMDTMMNGFVEITPGGGTPPYTFEWILDGSVVSTDEDPTGLSGGVYELVITDANGCQLSVSDIFIDNIVAISKLQLNNAIKVFPNPTPGILHVKFDLEETGYASFEIFDIAGRLIFSSQESNVYNQIIPLDLSRMSNGIYTLKIKVEDVFVVEKVVKHGW